jgi:hypothetical protein
MLGARTTIVALAFTLGPFVDDAVAVLGYVPALAAVVALEMCTEALVPGPMLPKLQLSVCVPTLPVIEQVPGPAYAGLMTQSMPDPAGSGSWRVTLVAVPVVPVSALLTVTVKPIVVPVLTGVASAVLVMDRAGASTTMVALAFTLGALVDEAVAVLG